jgi:hypothetical protein
MAKLVLTHTGKGPIDPRTNQELSAEGSTIYFNDLTDGLDQSQYSRSIAPRSSFTYYANGEHTFELEYTSRVEYSFNHGSIRSYIDRGYLDGYLQETNNIEEVADNAIEGENAPIVRFTSGQGFDSNNVDFAGTDGANFIFTSGSSGEFGGDGGGFEVYTGQGRGTNQSDGGDFTLTAGNGERQGGSFTLRGGAGNQGNGGSFSFIGGASTQDGGGGFYFSGGASNASNGGGFTFQAGSANAGGTRGGSVSIYGGVAWDNTTGNGGGVNIGAGGSRTENGGDVSISGGYCWASNKEGGDVNIYGGTVLNPADSTGGAILLRGGSPWQNAGNARGNGGDVTIEGGFGRNGGFQGGDVIIQGGLGHNGATAGEIKFPDHADGLLHVAGNSLRSTDMRVGKANFTVGANAGLNEVTINDPLLAGALSNQALVMLTLSVVDNPGDITVAVTPHLKAINVGGNSFTVGLDVTNNAGAQRVITIVYQVFNASIGL